MLEPRIVLTCLELVPSRGFRHGKRSLSVQIVGCH